MAYIGAPLVSTNFVLDQFTATASQTAFAMSRAPASAQSVLVGIDGVVQEPSAAYTIGGTTLTMTSGVPLNSRVWIVHLGVQGVLTTPADGSVTPAKLALTTVTNSLGADAALSNTALYFDGPSCAQGTAGTWLCTGTVTVQDTAGAGAFLVKLWDGTNVISSARGDSAAAGGLTTVAVSGVLTTPAANIRISVKDVSSTSGKILFNATGNSKDSTLTVVRIG